MAKPTKPKELKPRGPEGEGEAKEATKASGGGGGMDIKFIITIVAVLLCSVLASAGSIIFLGPMVLVPAITEQIHKGEGAHAEGGEAGAAEGEAAEKKEDQVGLTLELDEFTVNLRPDPQTGGSQFIRAKIALSIAVPESEQCHAAEAAPEGGHADASQKAFQNTVASAEISLSGIHSLSNPFIEMSASQIDDVPQQALFAKGQIVGAAAPIWVAQVPETQNAVDRTLIANEGGGGNPEEACLQAFQKKMGRYVPTVRDIINSALMKRTAAELSSLEGQEALKDEIKEQVNHLFGEDYKVLRVNFQDFIIQR